MVLLFLLLLLLLESRSSCFDGGRGMVMLPWGGGSARGIMRPLARLRPFFVCVEDPFTMLAYEVLLLVLLLLVEAVEAVDLFFVFSLLFSF